MSTVLCASSMRSRVLLCRHHGSLALCVEAQGHSHSWATCSRRPISLLARQLCLPGSRAGVLEDALAITVQLQLLDIHSEHLVATRGGKRRHKEHSVHRTPCSSSQLRRERAFGGPWQCPGTRRSAITRAFLQRLFHKIPDDNAWSTATALCLALDSTCNPQRPVKPVSGEVSQ
jgi:hypothetical protein